MTALPNSSVCHIFLQPGEFFFGAGTIQLHTLLGSCIAIIVWHPQRRLGGMCHYMLPERLQPVAELDGRYATEAMALFQREMARATTRPEDYLVSLYGGANMFPVHIHRQHNVALRNIAIARDMVALHHLRVVAEDVGGSHHRRIVFDLSTGNSWVNISSTSKKVAGPVKPGNGS